MATVRLRGEEKLASNDRILVLEAMPGKNARNVAGRVNTTLFTGTNKLHAIRDPQVSLWYFKYDDGVLPESLKCQFTSFPKLLTYARDYYKKRDIQIKEVIQ